MIYTTSVTMNFSSAHALRGYKGRCENLHGHNWKVRAALSGRKLDKIGMLVDFTDIKGCLGKILGRLDHRYLNEVPPFDTVNPTAENIAAHIFSEMKAYLPKGVKIAAVEVWESETSSATVTE
jgi:6-pyruvoyltetrahydropterin/6-carboxytetrahydropterin synthase